MALTWGLLGPGKGIEHAAVDENRKLLLAGPGPAVRRIFAVNAPGAQCRAGRRW